MLPESEFPALYRAADRTAVINQRRLLTATSVRLSSLVTAAVCGAFSLVVGRLDLTATIAAGAMGVALVTEVYLLTARPDRRWYEARAAAESAKTLAWRYLVGGEPFGLGAFADRPATGGVPPADGGAPGGERGHTADNLLLRRYSEITASLHTIGPVSVFDADAQVTEGMRAVRALPLEERRRHYVTGRLNEQRAWYTAKAVDNERRAARWLLLVAAAEALGLVTAAVKAALGGEGPDIDLPGMLSAVAAAGVAWLQTRQHQQVASAYAVAALELGHIVIRADWASTEDEWAHFVDEAEEAIAREHMLWTASHALSSNK
ncbi:membrane protein [Microbispora rosea subsp. aerata]|nr:DUF4231 domain-containing protein [Microbispora rosea]GGO16722.1 membrane protein [Microbispora rosea subsp. aerata]GIH56009.1 membrane protein [Microbispora rosea subsp. aerata]GLJ86905.1 membrane protein [Microbispora rosea subsp. aerata]